MARRLLALVAVAGVAATALLGLLTCGNQYALLMTIRAQESGVPLSVFDLRVKNLTSGEVVLDRIGERIDATRDLSQAGQELKVAVEFGEPGAFLVYILAQGGQGLEGSQYFLGEFQVNDIVEEDILLVPLTRDGDGDGFPACGASEIDCSAMSCMHLDCDDTDRNIHPFATEVCENGKDDDCSAGCDVASGVGDAQCVDSDGDSVPAGEDCDDHDPCRSPRIKERKNLCQSSASDWDNSFTQACREKVMAEGHSLVPPLCGDGIDQDCNGKDVACFVDQDCDEYTSPQDCQDNDPNINPQAAETCDGKDNNCNNVVDEGCLPCDVDGDKHAALNYQGTACDLPKDDPDDYDAGIHPETTVADGGLEGGTVLGALRGTCNTALEKNGKLRQREVDHDGDDKPASADGCPSEACDADGDGFQNAGCSPPKSLEDCNDNDPTVFPGAPDRCGDSVAEDCVADAPCTCDGDGDGFCPPADCDDKDANVHPWAIERCDGKDNDCDKLVDEGNPDAAGNPIPTSVDRTITCNNDPDGKCAPTTGICACSKIRTDEKKYNNNYPLDPNRALCPDESFAVEVSPRCFGAPSPVKEKCDNEDWNCNGNPFTPSDASADPTLNDYEDYGKACGTSIGECKAAGIVTGCDLGQAVDPLALAVLGAGYNPHWVCTLPGATQPVTLPSPERCNGLDDDCDGLYTLQEVAGVDPGWPERDERDTDNDGYMACSSCQNIPLAPSLVGCNDCQDGVKAIFPGAYETCDGTDNNCVADDEGTDQCQPPTSCCPTQKSCRNFNNDFQNCGGCGTSCPSDRTDSCANRTCVCGATGGPCTGNRNCVNQTCSCIEGGLCGGCCASNTCQGGNTTTYCGTGGETCATCTTTNPCLTPICNSSGNCATTPKANGTPCPGGICYNGGCCGAGQCWDGTACQSSNDMHCGNAGGACSTCGPTQDCVLGGCQCTASSCDAGCCADAKTCIAPPTALQCGTKGGTCTTCNSGQACINGKCDCTPTSCPNGCCSGSLCITPPTTLQCGTKGATCTSCNTGQTCVNGKCGCTSTSCPNGCCSGGLCVSPPTALQCGTQGGTCTSCSTGQICDTNGECKCDGSVCSGCCESNLCYSGTSDQQCGSAGANCKNCEGQKCINYQCTTVTPDLGIPDATVPDLGSLDMTSIDLGEPDWMSSDLGTSDIRAPDTEMADAVRPGVGILHMPSTAAFEVRV